MISGPVIWASWVSSAIFHFRAGHRRDLAPERETWCHSEGRTPWKLGKLKEHLRRRGILTGEKPSNGTRWLHGFTIRDVRPGTF
jgi:hypothetical protein